jgi:hypothetical protein
MVRWAYVLFSYILCIHSVLHVSNTIYCETNFKYYVAYIGQLKYFNSFAAIEKNDKAFPCQPISAPLHFIFSYHIALSFSSF